MSRKVRALIQLKFAVLLSITTVILLLMIVATNNPLKLVAQEPTNEPDPLPLGEERLSAFGLSPDLIEGLGLPFDLELVKRTSATSVASGSLVTFTIAITNHGPNSVPLAFFYDDYPAQMQDVVYNFSTSVISDGQAKPTWALTDPIADGGTVEVTVSGILTSPSTVMVQNTAVVSAFNHIDDTDPDNNSSTVTVNVTGSNPGGSIPGRIFFPIIFKNPPPPPLLLVYSEDFNSGEPWLEFNISECRTENQSGQYWVWHEQEDRTCLPPADNNDLKPQKPFRTFGQFEVKVYQSEGPKTKTAFGLFINGAGGDDYYYFRIWPNDDCTTGGDWQLVRRRDGDEQTLLQRNCDPAIRRGTSETQANILKIAHETSTKLTVYVENPQTGVETKLGSIFDNTGKHLTGEATGVYTFSEEDVAGDEALIKFDDFKVHVIQGPID